MQFARRLSTSIIGRSAAVLAVAFALAAAPAPAYAASSVRLMIDPGHGGKDPGAVGPGLLEKNSSLKISKMVEQAARRQGWDVAMTRGDDSFVGLSERPNRAARFKATDLVSIHSNSTGAKALGMMTIHRGGSSGRLGASIMKELAPLTPYADIGNRSDVRGLAVLRGATMPAVIVELLSVGARHENAALKDPARQREMAEAVVRGIARNHNVKYYPPVAPKAAKPAPKPAQKPKPAAESTAAPKVETTPAPKVDTTPSPKADTTSAAKPKVTPNVTATKAVPWPTVAPETSPWPRTERVIAPALAPKPVSGPTPAQSVFSRLATAVSVLFR